MSSTDGLKLWTVYDHPTDFPEWFVARLFEARDGEAVATGLILRAKTLDAVRDLLPPGLILLLRSPEDDPCVVETWF
jgi:hypothetical protein